MYCNQCGKQIHDHSRFCCYCGSSVTPAAAAAAVPVIPEQPVMDAAPAPENNVPIIPDAALVSSGTVPVIPDLAPEVPVISEPAAPPVIQEQSGIPDTPQTELPPPSPVIPVWTDIPADIPEPVGSYEEIMSEFSSGYFDPEPEPEPPVPEPEPETSGGSRKRGILIAISVLLILGLLIGTTILCIKVLIPDPRQDPILEDQQVESVSELPETPSAVPSPAVSSVIAPEPSSVVMPQISPPEVSEEPTAVPEVSALPSSTPTAAPTPTPSHNAASGNTTVAGSRYVDNVSISAYFRSAPEQSESNVITTVPLGTKVDYIEEYNSVYSKVKYNGTYGYIATQYLSETKPNLTVSGTVYLANVDYCAYFRSTPEKSDSNIITYVYLDEALDYIETTNNNYVKVKKGEYYGYVHVDYISFTAPNTTSNITMYVTGVKNGAYFLTYPRQGTTVLATLPPDTAVGYIENSMNGYCKVSYDGKIGYVLGDYLTETSPDQQANEEARDVLITYSLENDFVFYSFLDMNGDGIDEMLGSDTYLQLDNLWVSSSATLLVYEDGKVVEKGVLNEDGGDSPMFYVKQEDGTCQVVTEYSGENKYICTFYTLDKDGTLSYEAWSMEMENGVQKYYVDRNGTRHETTQTEHDGTVLTPDYYYVIYEGHVG